MKNSTKRYLAPLFLFTGMAIAASYTVSFEPKSSTINDVDEKINTDNYTKMMDVLTSPRCINCHPNDNIPKQGDDSHPHHFGMSRGKNNLGYEATKCTTCHQTENNDYSGVPGAPEWSLAPAQMFWDGLSRKEIAESMMDPIRNGGRTPAETMHHLTEHELVLWAWNPGVKADGTPREIPPVPLEEYKKAVKEWIENGAIIPEN